MTFQYPCGYRLIIILCTNAFIPSTTVCLRVLSLRDRDCPGYYPGIASRQNGLKEILILTILENYLDCNIQCVLYATCLCVVYFVVLGCVHMYMCLFHG